MTGPKIIPQADLDKTPKVQPQSGIRRTNVGTWVAVHRGVFAGEFRGLGAEAKAARAAGTTRMLP
jgi:hypothetical protein